MPRKVYRFLSFLLCFSLIFGQSGFTQIAGQLNTPACLLNLSNILVTDKFRPLHLRALAYDSANNNFQLLLDKGDTKELKDDLVKDSTQKLMEYFFVGLTLPNETFWVNLRPDSENEIINDELAKTDLGKVLLEADLQLKKDTARLTSPENPQGKLYWDRLYQKAEELLGQSEMNIPALVRPWIVPGEIIIRESGNSAYVYKATLKVMLEEDYLQGSTAYSFDDSRLKALNEYSSQLLRELILPQLTREVNASQRYAALRQAYYSLILAQWFKSRFQGQNSLCGQLINQKNLHQNLVSKVPWSKATYFRAYQKSFQDGEYKIQDTIYTVNGPSIRSYISGGMNLALPASSSVLTLQNNKPLRPSSTTLAVRYDGSTMASLAGTPVQVVSSSLDDAQASFPFMREPSTKIYQALQRAQGKFTYTYTKGGSAEAQDFEIALREAPGRYNTQVVLRLPGSQEEAGYLELETSEEKDTVDVGWVIRNRNYSGPGISVPVLSKLREVFPPGKSLHTTIGHETSLRQLMGDKQYLEDTKIGQIFHDAGWEIISVIYYDSEIGLAHTEPVREALKDDQPRDLRPGETDLPQGWLHVWFKPMQDTTRQPVDYGIDDGDSQEASSPSTEMERRIDTIVRQLEVNIEKKEAIIRAFSFFGQHYGQDKITAPGYSIILNNEQLMVKVIAHLGELSSTAMDAYLLQTSRVLSNLRDEGLAESIIDGLSNHATYISNEIFASGSPDYAFSFFASVLNKLFSILDAKNIPATPRLVQNIFQLSDIDAVVYAKALEYGSLYPEELDQIIKYIVATSDVGALQVRQAIADLLFLIDDGFFKAAVHPEYNYQEDEPIGIFRNRKLFESQFLDALPLPVKSPGTSRQPMAQIISLQEFRDLFTPERGPGFQVEGEKVVFVSDRAVRDFIARHRVDIVPPGEDASLASRWTTDGLLEAAQDFYAGATAVLLSESGKLYFFKECSDDVTAQRELEKNPFKGVDGFKAFVIGRYYVATFALDYRPPTIRPERMRPSPYNRIAKAAQEAVDAARGRSLALVTSDFTSVHNLADTQLSNMLVKYTWNGTIIDVKATDQIVSAEIKKKYDLRHSGLSLPGQASSSVSEFAAQVYEWFARGILNEHGADLVRWGGVGAEAIKQVVRKNIRQKIDSVSSEGLTEVFSGSQTVAFTHADLPWVIKALTDGKALISYRLAQQRLDGLVAPFIIIDNLVIKVYSHGISREITLPQAIVQEKVTSLETIVLDPRTNSDTLSGLFGELAQTIQEIWRRGVFDRDRSFLRNFGKTSGGRIVSFDAGRMSDQYPKVRQMASDADTLKDWYVQQALVAHLNPTLRAKLVDAMTQQLGEEFRNLDRASWHTEQADKLVRYMPTDKTLSDIGDLLRNQRASSPTEIQQDMAPGGIDFRSLPVTAQPITGPLATQQPIQLIPSAKLGEYWQDIQKSLRDSTIPSSDRILSYIQSSCDKKDAGQEIEKVITCIAEILRLEENQVIYTDPALKQILTVLESRMSPAEIRAALSRVNIAPLTATN
jgi:hypothetical protein